MIQAGKSSALLSSGSRIIKAPCHCVMKRIVLLSSAGRCYSDGEKYKDIDSVASPSKYRLPYSERSEFWYSSFSLFGAKRNRPPQLYRYDPKYFKLSSLLNWFDNLSHRKLIAEQQYLEERHNALGTDLAAAHFIVYRGGSVKFCDHSEWVTHGKEEYDDHLPNKYDPSFYVEALDLTGMKIVYEGLVNILDLTKLKWLSFKNCPHFDDWCLDRISGAYGDTLEYLDISNTKVTERGISVLYRMSKLNTLKVYNISNSATFNLTCLMLEDINPNINIEGVTHCIHNESALEQTKT